MLQPGSTMVARAKHFSRSFDERPLCECQGKGCASESRGLGGLGTGDMGLRSGGRSSTFLFNG